MTRIDVNADTLRVVIKGFDRILAFKGAIDIPLAHVSGVALHPEGASDLHAVERAPGTSIPGVVTAGSFGLADGSWLFVDVHDSTKTIRIDLDHEHYAALIVDVADPSATVSEIERALLGRT